ncbi:2-hydroxycyclohexanecarboxyl-CoA dehydrogenase [Rhodococcus opacus PD630]|uniref:SDR family oxidoreductase n=1 Tax=Rhodococcus TaxID=1827 RepID=UPI00029CD5E2|nr:MULTISPECIES: SDR family oxidoreductase [Rhodococcus]KXF53637.1 short-chain dehydrogenase [Rhodococcus sp. SC4]NDV03619.1 SDR family oxidoreductase [Rhodococcus sp. IEGM 248]RZK85082.1 MAG: SDR family oxidoreductase [Rhodococcus sp. (in: high G+C Gram-positive bacteria)]AHK29470.1 putative oxidoreductase ephD [Rhodococcus opacus PD630]EHI45808.1 2-hydroxycyclohexanecarboxyl-CoA dehydrogenase [Rhodococcus opacus PD630]
MAIKTLDGKKCLITGAGSGIGQATALAAAAEGAELFLTDINEVGLAQTVEQVGSRGGTVSFSRALDVSDYDAVSAFAADVHDQFGSLDVVMNVAGISAWGTVENLEHRHWKSMVDVNLMGPIHIIESFLPSMVRAGRGGHLVNVSSAAGLLALPWHAAYSASKFGLRGVSEVLRFDLKRHGIGVSLVVPGAVKTPLVGTVEIAGVDRDDPRIQKAVHRFEKRAVTPEKVASCIIAGIKKDRYLVYTSPDIRFGYWWARKFSPPYDFVMQRANDQFSKFL